MERGLLIDVCDLFAQRSNGFYPRAVRHCFQCLCCLLAHLAHSAAARQRVCLALLDTETGLLLNLANFGAAESAGRPVPAFNAANDTEGWDEESIAEPVSG